MMTKEGGLFPVSQRRSERRALPPSSYAEALLAPPSVDEEEDADNEHDQNIDNLSVDPNAILYSMINSLSDKVRDLEKENEELKRIEKINLYN